MTKKFKKIPVRGNNADEILALWKKGKLYFIAEEESVSEEEMLSRCRQDVLMYVSSINKYATAECQPVIDEMWEAIVKDNSFAAGLVMKQKQTLNRYFVTGLVYNLQVLGVYQPTEKVSQLKLHLALEGITEKNSVFKNWGNYPVSSSQRRLLRKYVSFYIESKVNRFRPQ